MSTPREPTAAAMAVNTAAILFVFVIAFTALLAGVYLITRPAIVASAAEEKMKLIADVLPSDAYNNDLLHDTVQLPPTALLGLDDSTVIYRGRKDGQPSALVFEAIAPDGYSGKIRLLVGVRTDGRIAGVRVIAHKETPGLGDYIEPKKDKKRARPWITQFEDRSLMNPAERGWKVKKDGGEFDANAGATITPRAIVKATRKALKFVEENRERLFL